MKLIFIYGPPAVGKLTVAHELANQLNFNVLHLYLTVDLISALFDINSEPYHRMNQKIRLDLIEEACKQKLNGIVFTYGYGTQNSDAFIHALLDLMKAHDGHVHFVYLYCKPEALFQRADMPSRHPGKIRNKQVLQRIIDQHAFPLIPFVENFKIDNTILAPEAVATMIKNHFKL